MRAFVRNVKSDEFLCDYHQATHTAATKRRKKNPYFSRITIWRKMPLSQEINNFIKVIHTRLYQELLHLFFALKSPRSNPHPDKAFFV